MKKILIKISLLLYLIFFNSSLSYAAQATGLATTYKITVTKLELCEQGSSIANCVNPITVSLPGIGVAVDLADITAGATAATVGDFGLATVGKTYTYIQTTMSRGIGIAGTVGTCTTSASGALTTNVANDTGSGTGKTAGTASVVTLYVPAMTNQAAYTMINSVSNSIGSDATEPGNINASHTHFQNRDALAKPFTLDPSSIPTVKMAFSTSQALKNINTGAANCTGRVFQAAPPTATITIQGQ